MHTSPAVSTTNVTAEGTTRVIKLPAPLCHDLGDQVGRGAMASLSS